MEQHTGWAAAMTQQQQQQQLGPSVSVVDHDTLKSEVCISSSLPHENSVITVPYAI